jgi:hypothetical protein
MAQVPVLASKGPPYVALELLYLSYSSRKPGKFAHLERCVIQRLGHQQVWSCPSA